jgi:tetratricopeptide (TPR) repeat protein
MSKGLADYIECKDPFIFSYFAISLFHLGQCDNAIIAINKAIALDRKSDIYYAIRAVFNNKKGNIKQALFDIHMAINLCKDKGDLKIYKDLENNITAMNKIDFSN